MISGALSSSGFEELQWLSSGSWASSVPAVLSYLPLGSWRQSSEMIHPGVSPAAASASTSGWHQPWKRSKCICRSSRLGCSDPNCGKYGILERRWRSVPYEVMSLQQMDTCRPTPTSLRQICCNQPKLLLFLGLFQHQDFSCVFCVCVSHQSASYSLFFHNSNTFKPGGGL